MGLVNDSCFPLSGWARRAQAFWPDRAFASVGRTPPTTAAFLVGPDAAGVGVLAGPRVRPRRADGARPSSFPPPLARPLFSFLDVERPFLPLSRSFFSALGELFSSFFNTKWRSVLIFITCLIVDIHSGALFTSRGGFHLRRRSDSDR